jgi:cyclopropane-fatty-acyl-phospholipid synthase
MYRTFWALRVDDYGGAPLGYHTLRLPYPAFGRFDPLVSQALRRMYAFAPPFGPPSLNAYGSAELEAYEQRLTVAFARSYRLARERPVTLADLGESSTEGPMVEQTDTLMAVHYDEQLPFFESILDRRFRAYSMAYYGETSAAARTTDRTLEKAQEAKFDLMASRARLDGHEHVLNVGCGFGSLETFLLARFPGLRVTGITPSRVQAAYLRTRMADPDDPLGSGRFRLLEDRFDTADVGTLGHAAYDVVFSVGVLEHFKNLGAAFARMAALLRPGGRMFHHLIVARRVIPGFADAQRTRLRQYFPGGRVWPMEELERPLDTFTLDGAWYVNGMNYWRTVDAWHRRYWERLDRLYPTVLDEKAARFWNEYFTFSKVMFLPEDGSVVGNGQFLYRKRA